MLKYYADVEVSEINFADVGAVPTTSTNNLVAYVIPSGGELGSTNV